MPAPKVNNAERDQRIDDVVQLLLGGAQRRDILKACAKMFGVSARQTDRYIASAYARIAAEKAPERTALVNTAHARYTRLFMKSLAAGNFSAAIAAQDRIVSLFGLAAPTRSAVDVRIDHAQLAQVLEMAEARGMSAGDLFADLIAEMSNRPEQQVKHMSDAALERIARQAEADEDDE